MSLCIDGQKYLCRAFVYVFVIPLCEAWSRASTLFLAALGTITRLLSRRITGT